MKKLYAFFRHNSGICIGFFLAPFILIYAYSCQSVVFSGVNPSRKINRQQLVIEVDTFLAQAELKFSDLDRQDMVKDSIFNSVLDLANGIPTNPMGVMLMIGNALGLGAVIDNVRKRTHINTLKGSKSNGKENEPTEESTKTA